MLIMVEGTTRLLQMLLCLHRTDIILLVLHGAIGSLKGPKHGGANLAVAKQMELVIDKVGLNATDEQLKQVIKDILDKKFNDQSGLIYGIGTCSLYIERSTLSNSF